ncbi:GCN5-related N-acetyltransferase 7, chloroplastic isoform X2 [Salvia miltiorrhiza]|uniref:GCN5-related N-acetyltransferase 7, chloroplastic isoform X2 n=1 Tax=Salvia miltiorrhiza TaxID=226208 RepID=UPI0025AD7F75|nr:GCN5-related N-acetyltransferase 7, chloroplastic isoform X2 [Salvia miltiorrhiza]
MDLFFMNSFKLTILIIPEPELSGWRRREMLIFYIPTPPPHASFAAPFNHVHGGAASLPRRPSLGLYCQLSDHQTAHQLATPPVTINRSLLSVSATCSEAELLAATRLRVRTFYDFNEQTFGIEFSQNGEDRVVVGTLDLNQCVGLPDELVGMKPQGIGSDFARAYISNVCVAEELHRNGLGYELIAESKRVAQDWGISDLYVHVAVNNEAAKNLYLKSGFTVESDEPAWQARFLDRPRRLLLWTGLPITYQL